MSSASRRGVVRRAGQADVVADHGGHEHHQHDARLGEREQIGHDLGPRPRQGGDHDLAGMAHRAIPSARCDTTGAVADRRARHHPHRQDHAGGQDETTGQAVRHRQRQDRQLPARNPDRGEADQIGADAEQELDGEQEQQGAGGRRRHRVAGAAQTGGHDRHQGEHGERADQVKVDPPGVGEERAEHDLHIDEQRRRQREAAGAAVQRRGRLRHALGGDQRDRDDQREEPLGQRAVHHREAVGEQHDPQPAHHALGDHRQHGDDPQRPQASAARPERDGQRHRQQPDHGAEEPVTVLVEHAADHPRPGKQEHVVAEGRGPVGHGQGRARVGHETAEDDEHASRGRGQHGQPVRPPHPRHPRQWPRVSGHAPGPLCALAPATAADNPRPPRDRCTRTARGRRSGSWDPS